ncbi:Ger(x)C family spore germination protein [Alkaliphilus transvaalensis]|uniref:Ger(x)C family spore germination protein n=1 Tax=Alkaliphilus transvaalensis TaxID=114628 RepID=UPI00047A8B9F|nr:Ger(x)C family spore germination protein [Alkaliphilus transvaalensis]
MRRASKLVILILICGLFTSCWDAKQLEDLYLVYGIGVDLSEENPGKYLVTVAAPTVLPEAEAPKVEISAEGASLRNAQDNIQNKAARRITFNNTHLLIVGEEVAKRGLEQHTDSLLRDPEGRGTMKLMITEGRAVDLMELNPPASALVSLYLADLLKQSQETSTIPLTTLRSFNNALKTDGIEPVMPYLKYGNRPDEFLVNTIALFNSDRMIGKIEGVDSFLLIVLRGEVNDGFMSLPYPLGDADESPILTLRVISGKNKIKTEIRDAQLHIFHEVSLIAHISEYTAPMTVLDEKIIKEMENAANLHLEGLCKQLINRLQIQYVSDNIGYGRYVKANHKDFFDAENWNKQFSNANIQVKGNVQIKMIGTKQ